MSASGGSRPDQAAQAGQDRERLYCLGLGSNIAPEVNLPGAVRMLRQMLDVRAVSTAWETPAVGAPGPDFLNAALLAWACLPPEALKSQVIRGIEASLGRVRGGDKNAPRPMDIDILVIDNEVVSADLWEQAYLAVPVAELLPGLRAERDGEPLAAVAVRLAAQVTIVARPEVLSFWTAAGP